MSELAERRSSYILHALISLVAWQKSIGYQYNPYSDMFVFNWSNLVDGTKHNHTYRIAREYLEQCEDIHALIAWIAHKAERDSYA